MKLYLCQFCRHKLLTLAYAPKYCRACRSKDFESYSFAEWIAVAVVALGAIYSLLT